MEAIKRVLVVVLPLLLAFILNRRFNTRWMPIGPVVERHFQMHSTRGAYGGKVHDKIARLYIISGGCGFTGSWIARYLLLRGEKHVHLVDRVRPAPDLLKHGVIYHEVNLADPGSIEPLIKRLSRNIQDETHVIVYNCCVVKRYWAPNFLVDLGVSTTETFFVALRLFQRDQITLIHIGDTLAHRKPIKNWDRIWPTKELWNQTAASDTAFGFSTPGQDDSNKEARDRAFSSYAWHQLAVERLVLQLPNLENSVKASSVLRVEGFLTGHIGDSLIVPCIEGNRAILHSPNTSVTLVHVEDVARAALSLEHSLMDPATHRAFNGKQFTVSSDEVTTMQHVFDYIQKKRPKFHVIHLEPVLVFIITAIVAFFSPLMKIGLTCTRSESRNESLFQGMPYTMTFARFYTLQAGQIPDKSNIDRQHDVLGVKNNFSLSQTLDMICDEVSLLESQLKEKEEAATLRKVQ